MKFFVSEKSNSRPENKVRAFATRNSPSMPSVSSVVNP